MDHELGNGGVERVIAERQVLCRRQLDVDARQACPDRLDEGLGRVHRSDRRRPEPSDQFRRECPRPASDIEDTLIVFGPLTLAKSASCGASGIEHRPMKRSYASAATLKLMRGV